MYVDMYVMLVELVFMDYSILHMVTASGWCVWVVLVVWVWVWMGVGGWVGGCGWVWVGVDGCGWVWMQ